jgi:hypothetical protein
MSKGAKTTLIILAIAIVVCLIGAGVTFFVFQRLVNQVQSGINPDPTQTAKILEEMPEFDMPPGYELSTTMDFFTYKMVMLAPEEYVGPLITLTSFNQSGVSAEQMQRQLEQQNGIKNMKLVETKKMTINGQEVDVSTYESSSGSYVMRQLVTVFNVEKGMVMIMIQGDKDEWDDTLIENFLLSIR